MQRNWKANLKHDKKPIGIPLLDVFVIELLTRYNSLSMLMFLFQNWIEMTVNIIAPMTCMFIHKFHLLDAKSQMEHFKSFFGHKYSEQQQQQQTTESNGLMQEVK